MGLTEMPDNFSNDNLKTLILANNKLTKLPNLGKAIDTLSVQQNQLKSLPDGSYQNLVYLNARGNSISYVPKGILQSAKLKVLHLEQNNLRKLPDVWNCPSLIDLRLSGNALTELPESFQALSALTNLYFLFYFILFYVLLYLHYLFFFLLIFFSIWLFHVFILFYLVNYSEINYRHSQIVFLH